MRLLIIGTLNGHVATASKIAFKRGSAIAHVDDVDAALKSLRSGKGADLIFVDVTLAVGQLTSALQAERFHIPVVACGIDTDPHAAAEAIRQGAKEYVPLPPDHELIAAVFEAVARDETAVIHQDPVMKNVLRLAEQFAPSDASVLITGESGTGKEVMARFIHTKSRRRDKPFISVNCAAIPENLLESELFGHEKGAFTGAVAQRIGKFEEANGGTLLLDEISEMHIRLQAKLLRAIQEREIDRVGGTKPVKVDIRILATSNRNLEEEVRLGNFREDLYYRLNVVNLRLPALRERPLDLEVLAEHFIDKYCQANGMPRKTLSKAAAETLRHYGWKGNVRELENVMHRAVVMALDQEIKPEDLQLSVPPRTAPAAQTTEAIARPDMPPHPLVGRTVAEVEKDLILGTLSHCLGNRTQTANILGISIRTLRNKLKQYSDEGVAIIDSQDSLQEAS
ncbi:MAG: sigma 54-interacting transcriptional regulator [Holosporales bacterium]